jgi:hypothetical protein
VARFLAEASLEQLVALVPAQAVSGLLHCGECDVAMAHSPSPQPEGHHVAQADFFPLAALTPETTNPPAGAGGSSSGTSVSCAGAQLHVDNRYCRPLPGEGRLGLFERPGHGPTLAFAEREWLSRSIG